MKTPTAPRKRLSSDYLQSTVYPIVLQTMTMPAQEAVSSFKAAGMKYTAKQVHRLRVRARRWSAANTNPTPPTATTTTEVLLKKKPPAGIPKKVGLPKEGTLQAFVCGLPLEVSSRDAAELAKRNGFPACDRAAVGRIWWYYKSVREQLAGTTQLTARRPKPAPKQQQAAAYEVAPTSNSVTLAPSRPPVQRDAREDDRNRLRIMILELGMKESREVWHEMQHITNSLSARVPQD